MWSQVRGDRRHRNTRHYIMRKVVNKTSAAAQAGLVRYRQAMSYKGDVHALGSCRSDCPVGRDHYRVRSAKFTNHYGFALPRQRRGSARAVDCGHVRRRRRNRRQLVRPAPTINSRRAAASLGRDDDCHVRATCGRRWPEFGLSRENHRRVNNTEPFQRGAAHSFLLPKRARVQYRVATGGPLLKR
jgi:hypothetical protein